MTTTGVRIDIDGLRKSYNGVAVLRGIDLHIEPGETLVIVGGSGEGKSVLLRHIAGLEEPDAGSIRFNGIDLSAYQEMRAAAKPFRLAMVFQGAALLNSLTVAENVALRLLEHGKSRREVVDVVATCLEQVGLKHTEDKLPADLSGGMRKRVAIARALAAEPQLVLHDEPTADLDPILTGQIAELIANIGRRYHATQVIVTHNLAVATSIGDRIAVLRGGEMVDILPAHALKDSQHPFTQEFVKAATMHL